MGLGEEGLGENREFSGKISKSVCVNQEGF